jgi:hypothetical protein
MDIHDLEKLIDEVIEEGPTSDRETLESLLRFRE